MYNRCLRACDRLKCIEPHIELSLNDYELNILWHVKLFRIMQSICKTLTAHEQSVDLRHFLAMFQFHPGYAPVVFQEMFQLCKNPRRNVLIQPKVQTVKYGQRSMRFYGASFWNKMPPEIRGLKSSSEIVTNYIKTFLRKQSGIVN